MKISRKARKLLSVVLTVVLAIGTFQFAPGVRTIAKAADAPEAGQSYTLNFAKAFSEKTQLNGYTSEDGVDRKSTRLNSSHTDSSRMPSSA